MFDTTLLILLGLAALGFISHNTTVAISILVLIIVRVTPLNAFFPWVEKQGLTVGIIILTIGVMAPIASGTLPPSTLIHSFMNWKSLLAIAVGVFVSWLGGRGVSLSPAPGSGSTAHFSPRARDTARRRPWWPGCWSVQYSASPCFAASRSGR
jgi:uncharacterized membrane protein (DUF441 family)